MLSLCTFFVLLAIGYFLIDSKTQTELVNKCKQNKFFILAGLIFIYFFFYRNNIEGLTTGFDVDNITPEKYTEFVTEMCYNNPTSMNKFIGCLPKEQNDNQDNQENRYIKPPWINTDTNTVAEGKNTDCFLWMMDRGNKNVISNSLKRDDSDTNVRIVSCNAIDNQRANDSDVLFKYPILAEVGNPETVTIRIPPNTTTDAP